MEYERGIKKRGLKKEKNKRKRDERWNDNLATLANQLSKYVYKILGA